jgi:hypothetical protein
LFSTVGAEGGLDRCAAKWTCFASEDYSWIAISERLANKGVPLGLAQEMGPGGSPVAF